MSDLRPVGSVVFGPGPKRGKKPAEIPVIDDVVKAAAHVLPKPEPEPDGADFPDFGTILASAKTGERPTETRTFEMKGKRYKFEIYVDGRDHAELWSGLCTAMQYGYSQQFGAKLAGKEWEGVKESYPVGAGVKTIIIKDPAYIGSVRVLQLVLKNPAWSLDECLMMGEELGRGFVDVCAWAAEVNGVTEKVFEELAALEKNAPSLSR